MTATTLNGNRFGPTDLLALSVNDIDGDQTLDFELPIGYGDAALEGWLIRVSTIDVILANPELYGPSLTIVNAAAGVVLDIVDNNDTRWKRLSVAANAGVVSAGEQMRRKTLWRYGESVRVRFQEIDTDATPTADCTAYFRVQRLRSP